MNKKEIIEKIKQTMPNWDEKDADKQIKIALFIYLTLGKMKSFDEHYYFSNSDTRKKLYQLAREDSKKIEKVARNKKVICVTLSHLYISLLKEFGIQGFVTKGDLEEHVYPILLLEGGRVVQADLQQDLYRIQTRETLQNFGKKGYDDEYEISDSLLTKYLIEMGYIQKEEDYQDQRINQVKKEIEGLNVIDSVDFILKNPMIYEQNQDIQIIELEKYYKAIFNELVPQWVNKKLFTFHCYREKEKERQYSTCVFTKEKHMIKVYLYVSNQNRFFEVSIEKMRQLQQEGLTLGLTPKENGVKMFCKMMKQQESRIKE